MGESASFCLDSLVELSSIFSKGITFDNGLSKITLRENVVRITGGNREKDKSAPIAGCGLKLTTDGYIATAYHVVEPLFTWNNSTSSEMGSSFRVIEQRGKKSKLDLSFLVADIVSDLALVKVYSSGPGEPLKFNISHSQSRKTNPLTFIGLNHSTSQKRILFGRMLQREKRFPPLYLNHSDEKLDTLYTDIKIQPGDSGGVFLNRYGSLIGLCCSASYLIPPLIFPWTKLPNIMHLETRGVKVSYLSDLIDLAISVCR